MIKYIFNDGYVELSNKSNTFLGNTANHIYRTTNKLAIKYKCNTLAESQAILHIYSKEFNEKYQKTKKELKK